MTPETFPNPLADRGVADDINKKALELCTQRITAPNEGIADYVRRIVVEAARWGYSEGFRMGWRIHEVRTAKK